MPYVKVGTENSADILVHYEDHGSGKPIVLIHGYPLNGNSWERQERVLLQNGYRCISYDRRGFGQSSQPTTGYDYDTFTADLKALLDHLALDQDMVLAGFSMGTGEVTRYLGTHGSAGVSKAVLLGVIPPFLLKTDDNPKGVPGDVFDGIKETVLADRYAWFDGFFADFNNTDVLAPERIGDAALRASFQVAAGASPYASYACVDSWLTDFRGDLPKIDVPTLVVHGTADRILPFEATAARLRDENLIADLTVVAVDDGPHNIGWTHPDEVNGALLDFLGRQGLVIETSEQGGCPLAEHLRKILDGPIVWSPGVKGAVALSRRGGDFIFDSGQDVSIGYERHDAEAVALYLQESFSFRAATPEAAVALTA